MQPVGRLLAASRPLAERGILWPVGRRLMVAAVLLVAQLLSVYTLILFADASHFPTFQTNNVNSKYLG